MTLKKSQFSCLDASDEDAKIFDFFKKKKIEEVVAYLDTPQHSKKCGAIGFTVLQDVDPYACP